MKPSYTVIDCKSACTKLKPGRFPFQWDLNIYRGCMHGCKYCYALYSHKYLDDQNFHSNIYVKGNIVEQLERQLALPRWKNEIINCGGVTDSYQAAEVTYKFMPDILKLLIKYRTPMTISTKSSLILRDYDLYDQLSRQVRVNIAVSIVTTKEELRKTMEAGASPIRERFRVLEEFRRLHVSRGVHCMPVIPLLTDSSEDFETLAQQIKEVQPNYVLPGILYLRGETKTAFLHYLQQTFPEKSSDFRYLYRSGKCDQDYKVALYQRLFRCLDKYRLTYREKTMPPQDLPPEQLTLW